MCKGSLELSEYDLMDLSTAIDVLIEVFETHKADPDLLHYISMMTMSLAGRVSKSPKNKKLGVVDKKAEMKPKSDIHHPGGFGF